MTMVELEALKARVLRLKRFVRVGANSREHLLGRITREIARRAGYDDRRGGLPCRSANGTYLDGWYDSDGSLYFLMGSDFIALRRAEQRPAVRRYCFD